MLDSYVIGTTAMSCTQQHRAARSQHMSHSSSQQPPLSLAQQHQKAFSQLTSRSQQLPLALAASFLLHAAASSCSNPLDALAIAHGGLAAPLACSQSPPDTLALVAGRPCSSAPLAFLQSPSFFFAGKRVFII